MTPDGEMHALIDKRLSKLENERGSSTTADLALLFVLYLGYVFYTHVDLGVYINGVIP